MTNDEVSFLNKIFLYDCKHFSSCDLHHKHIVTGGFKFISTNELRKLFSKGHDYCVNKTIIKNPKILYRLCSYHHQSLFRLYII